MPVGWNSGRSHRALKILSGNVELLIADAPPYSTELYSTSLNAGQEKGVCQRVCQQFMTEVDYVGVFRRRIPHANARPVFRARIEIIVDYLRWQVVLNDGASILEALEIEQRYQISFWDALIIQAAQASGVEVLYSEDLSDASSIKGPLFWVTRARPR